MSEIENSRADHTMLYLSSPDCNQTEVTVEAGLLCDCNTALKILSEFDVKAVTLSVGIVVKIMNIYGIGNV